MFKELIHTCAETKFNLVKNLLRAELKWTVSCIWPPGRNSETPDL